MQSKSQQKAALQGNSVGPSHQDLFQLYDRQQYFAVKRTGPSAKHHCVDPSTREIIRSNIILEIAKWNEGIRKITRGIQGHGTGIVLRLTAFVVQHGDFPQNS